MDGVALRHQASEENNMKSFRLHTSRKHRAFTLVEIMIVTVILAILAAIVSQKVGSAFAESQTNALQMSLYRVRSQIQLYYGEHSTYPTLANFANQMTMASNITGNTAAPGTPGFPFGPYIRSVPNNPMTSSSTVGNGAVGSSDWYYDQVTGAFHANDSATTFAF